MAFRWQLYGKGYVLRPDAGIGLYLYSGLDYAEYYSQFPSHNTVCVDGISSYPVMKALIPSICYPVFRHLPQLRRQRINSLPLTYSDDYFREPESHADQTRMMSIVTTGPETGYYVDIFRSRKERGGDKMHDYFYHNLGQEMTLTAADGTDCTCSLPKNWLLPVRIWEPYSYLFDKKCARTAKDVKAVFTIRMPDKDDIRMNMWMKGEKGRHGVFRSQPYDRRSEPYAGHALQY